MELNQFQESTDLLLLLQNNCWMGGIEVLLLMNCKGTK